MEMICASCDEPTPDGAVVCPRCEVREETSVRRETLRRETSDLRAGKVAVVMAFVLGVGAPGFAMLLGIYGLYRLSRVAGDLPDAARWRRFGIIAVVLLAVFWGMLHRAASGV